MSSGLPTGVASASASASWSWSYRSCSNHSTTCCPSFSARTSCRSLSSSEARIDRLLPQPHAERNAARAWSSSCRGPAGTGPSCSTSCQGSTAPPSAVCRSVFPALSPLVTCNGDGRTVASRPRRARYAAPQVQWSSDSHAQPTIRASSSRIRRRPAMRASISSIFAAARVRSAAEAGPLRATRRYSSISARVKPIACASLMARRKRTASSS